MSVTIKDVARACGVHVSTVSRAFSAPHLVNPETRTRVLAAAESLGYRPNRAARALITGRTHNIGLIIADIANPFFPPLVKAAESQARKRDYHLFVADTDEDPAVEEELVQALAKQVDGIVLCSPRMPNASIERLRDVVPLVVVNRLIPGLPSVAMDVAQATRTSIEHLVGLGHRDLALVTGPRGSWTNREIRRAATATARSLDARLTVLGPNPPTEKAGVLAASQVRAANVTGVLAYNDLMAIGLMQGLAAEGRTVPGDISVVGFDDITLGRYTQPKLTTVSAPSPAAGRMAVDMLLADDEQRRTTAQVILQTELVIRESTGPAPHRPTPPGTAGGTGRTSAPPATAR